MSKADLSGNIVFGFIMGAVNVILVELITHDGSDTKAFHLVPLICVCVAWGEYTIRAHTLFQLGSDQRQSQADTTVVKFLLFLYCCAIRSSSSQVQVLWEDHRNDLFTNGFSILSNAGGAKLKWWIDPVGAMVLAIIVIGLWARTVYEQFTFLAGIAAPREFVSMVTYKAMTFSEEIKQVDTVRVYHSGPDYVVEVDIVLDPEMPLWKAHDISQDLQDQIEALPNVDRCFVHVDHEVDHKPEHRKKQ
ncbi:hypothetical protein A1Q1_02914 [Trichosporon asahii var. asahii CBS 2479]|uniref:Cation efflux protein cytoplasmic domain-containing protein n=1 Tax=Trichosporon asahii var. asahii (strain ATCC 90039 / CBS 2479 / JCM 2466 / KCTC 7840 / NBRC 103889/ NCYC 2677 / UAMH 7654) TaxID=1186058 RepID=J6EU63_TRIAS|nr:hypothetical protein A1Q1_02914 [Trichosporon asahii var. asahii CBS 2479]EJT48104.1 hypothetical protein A1Q1_02914 [Trichosporon asahii var. asahii CBS 2479]